MKNSNNVSIGMIPWFTKIGQKIIWEAVIPKSFHPEEVKPSFYKTQIANEVDKSILYLTKIHGEFNYLKNK